MNAPSISIVMVLFGQRRVTERGLASLALALGDKLGDEIELVLVDNASPDDTGALLNSWEGRATVVRHEHNLNFSGGCNSGAQHARGEVVVFCNNDMEFVPGVIESVAATATEPGVGAAGVRLVFPDGSIQHGGVVWTPSAQGPPMPQHLFHHESGDLPPARAVLDLDAVTAACIAIRRDLFSEIGGFDTAYRNGLEDIDLCLRVRSRGLRIVYRGDLCLVHLESATRGEDWTASAHNDAVFQGRWGAECDSDEEMVANVFGGRVTTRSGVPLVGHEWNTGTRLCVEGHLRSVAPEAAEARALLAALEQAGLAPAARDRLPAWVIAALEEDELATLARAEGRLRSPAALRIDVPAGTWSSMRRRQSDIVRLARAPADPERLAGAAAIWTATPALAAEIVAAGVDERLVTSLPPAIAQPPEGSGGEGLLALLPGHDLRACAKTLASLPRAEHVRLLPNVLSPGLATLARELAGHAELLAPITSEARFAALAGRADLVLCVDPSDVFERRALIAAATGTAIASPPEGVAAQILGTALADAGGRSARRAAVAEICEPAVVAERLRELVARVEDGRLPLPQLMAALA